METVIFEVIKAIGVILFLGLFYLGYKKAFQLGQMFNDVLKEKNISLKKEYHNKSLSKFIRIYFFYAAVEKNVENFLENKMNNTKEFEMNRLYPLEEKI